MTTTAPPAGTVVHGVHFGPWVTVRHETCRGGRVLTTAVDHRSHRAVELSDDDLTADGTLCAPLVDELRGAGLLADAPHPATEHPTRRRLHALRRFVATLDVSWPGADSLVRRLHRWGLHRCFGPAAVAVQVVLALAGIAATVSVVTSAPSVQLHLPARSVPVAIAVGLVAVGVHELAHALVVTHHGRSVDSIGFRLHLGAPSFYVESTEALVLTRRQRLVQAAAGPWAEWLFTSVVALALWAFAPAGSAAVVLTRFVALNVVTIASNLVPFGGLDGSHLLADAVRVPDLARRSRRAVGRVLTAPLHRRPLQRGDVALGTYAVVNVVVSAALFALSMVLWVQLFGGLVASLWHRGPLGAALVLAAGIVLCRPAVVAVLPDVVEVAGSVSASLHDLRFRRSVEWRRAAMRELHRTEPAVAQLDDRALGIAAGLLQAVRGRTSVRPDDGVVLVSVPPMRGARRGVTAVLDLDVVQRVAA